MKSWNFAIVGAGVIAEFHAKAIKDMENAKLTAVCDVNLERAQDFANKFDCKAYSDIHEMFEKENIDVVTIATPSGLHMETAIAAAKHKVHTLIEKPMEITTERINKIDQAHKQAGTKLGCIFQTRYSNSLDPLRNAINNGRFGKITFAGVHVPWWREDSYYKNSWHGTWEIDGGGALMNQAIHLIDTLCEIMPEVESVGAMANSIGHPDIEAEDTAVAVLKFKDGALGVIHGSTASFPGQPKRLEISGTEGTVVYIEDSYNTFDFKNKLPEDQKVLEEFGEMKYKCGFSDPKAIAHTLHTACFEDFVDSIKNEKEFKINTEEAIKSVRLIEAIYTSAAQGKLINL